MGSDNLNNQIYTALKGTISQRVCKCYNSDSRVRRAIVKYTSIDDPIAKDIFNILKDDECEDISLASLIKLNLVKANMER